MLLQQSGSCGTSEIALIVNWTYLCPSPGVPLTYESKGESVEIKKLRINRSEESRRFHFEQGEGAARKASCAPEVSGSPILCLPALLSGWSSEGRNSSRKAAGQLRRKYAVKCEADWILLVLFLWPDLILFSWDILLFPQETTKKISPLSCLIWNE